MESPNIPLKIDSIKKSYGKHQVLNNISMHLEPNEIFGLIGLNGIGKTTLIKSILQLTRSDAKHASLFGVDTTSDKARKKVAYLPEKFHPSKHLKGYEYLELNLDYYGLELNKTQANQYARDLDLNVEKLNQKISSYSKGMGQKIGLIGAFLSQCPLLILDEPMSGLDPLARIALKKKMIEYRKEGNTIFFSSHILADMDEICDRVGIIHNGRIRYIGTPESFKKEFPQESLEKSFLQAIAA